jgi:hypothetical protein
VTGGNTGDFTVAGLIGGWDCTGSVLAMNQPGDLWVEMATRAVTQRAPDLVAAASVPRPSESGAGRWPGGGGDRELVGYMAARS